MVLYFSATGNTEFIAKEIAKRSGLVQKGDTIVITGGTPNGKSGNSNLINIETV